MTAEEAHEYIATEAARIANKISQSEITAFASTQTEIFEPFAGLDGAQIALRLKFDVSSDPDLLKHLKSIAARAVKQSIVDNQNIFVNGIVSDAKAGKMYFDRWK